jgi:hypothetical protein
MQQHHLHVVGCDFNILLRIIALSFMKDTMGSFLIYLSVFRGRTIPASDNDLGNNNPS